MTVDITRASRDEIAALQLTRLEFTMRRLHERLPHYRANVHEALAPPPLRICSGEPRHRTEALIGIDAEIEVTAVGGIGRSEGKAKRIADSRKA